MKSRDQSLDSGSVKDFPRQWEIERPDLDPIDYLPTLYLIRIGEIVEKMGEKRWKDAYGLSAAEYRILLALRRSGGDYALRPTELFKTVLVTSGAMTKNVNRLSEQGFVERRQHPDHKGSFLVHLTKRGRKIADHIMKEMAEHSIVSRARLSLSVGERKTLIKLCEKILTDIESDAEFAQLKVL